MHVDELYEAIIHSGSITAAKNAQLQHQRYVVNACCNIYVKIFGESIIIILLLVICNICILANFIILAVGSLTISSLLMQRS